MDKKNTILLTVIAVATLLVAVVGATFAYYSVQVSANKTAVNVNATAGSVGVLTLDAPVKNLYMNLLPSDMVDLGSDTHYYATANANSEDLSTSNKSDQKVNHVISKLAVEGGVTGTNYTCKAKLKVTLNTAEGSMGAVLKTGDAKLFLEGVNVDLQDFTNGLDLHDILDKGTQDDAQNKYNEYNITYHVNGSKAAEIKADLELTNKTGKNVEVDNNQSYIAGKTLKVTIEVVSEGDKLDCSIDAAPAE